MTECVLPLPERVSCMKRVPPAPRPSSIVGHNVLVSTAYLVRRNLWCPLHWPRRPHRRHRDHNPKRQTHSQIRSCYPQRRCEPPPPLFSCQWPTASKEETVRFVFPTDGKRRGMFTGRATARVHSFRRGVFTGRATARVLSFRFRRELCRIEDAIRTGRRLPDLLAARARHYYSC